MAKEHLNTEIRKKQILDAISQIVLNKGSEHVTIRNISKAINLSEAAIYRHFKDKKEIFLFLIDYITDILKKDLAEADLNNINTKESFTVIIKKLLFKIEEQKGITFLIIAEILSLGIEELNVKLLKNINFYLGLLEGLVKRSLDKNIFKKNIDPELTALIIFNSIQGLVFNWYLNNFKYNLVEKFDLIWENLKFGLFNN